MTSVRPISDSVGAHSALADVTMVTPGFCALTRVGAIVNDVPDDLVALFVSYAANVAADFTRGGVGFLSRKLRKTKEVSTNLRSTLNYSLQAELASRGVGSLSAERVAGWLLDDADIAHLFVLWEAQDTSSKYSRQYHDEVRAHLRFNAHLEEDLDVVTEVVLAVLASAGSVYLAAERVRKTARSPGFGALAQEPTRPAATFVFADHSSRLQQFTKAGESSLAQIAAFTDRYLAHVRNSMQGLRLQHLGPRQTEVSIDKLFVPPRFRPEESEFAALSTEQLLMASKRAVILGPAGSGKSTAVRHASLSLAKLDSDRVVPLLIELRKTTNVAKSSGTLFLDVFRGEIRESMQEEPPDGWLEFLLLTGRAIVFFDGFDEVLVAGRRSEIRDAIRSFSQLYPASSVVVTSRVTGYEIAPLPGEFFSHAFIRELDETQVSGYVRRWFAFNARGNANPTDLTVTSFLEESSTYAADIRVNPLMLSLLCSVYYTRGDIPRSLSELYERCASLLYHQWNTMRGVEDHGAWNADVRPAIYHIADLVLRRSDYLAEGIPIADLKRELTSYWAAEQDLDWVDAAQLAEHLVEIWSGRAWLVTAVASDEDNHPRFGFVHQSFLEYFAAVYAVRAVDTAIDLLARLRDRLIYMNGWSVAQLAVSTFSARRGSGGSLFVDALLKDAAQAPAAEQLALLRFAISLSAMVRIEPHVRRRLFGQIISLVGDSIVKPSENQTLDEVHEVSRDTHAQWSQLSTEDILPEIPEDTHAIRETYSSISLSTLESERLALELLIAFENDARFDVQLSQVLEEMSGEDRDRDRDTLASILVLGLANHLGLYLETTKATVVQLIRDARLTSSWYTLLGAVAIGALEKTDCVGALPWHVFLVKESLFLSLEHDLLTPTWLEGNFNHLDDEDHDVRVLSAIGESIATQSERGTAGISIMSIDSARDGLSIQRPASGQLLLDWTAWDDAAIVGYTVLLRVCADCWGIATVLPLVERLPVSAADRNLDLVTSGGRVTIPIPRTLTDHTEKLLASIASGALPLVTNRRRDL